jgi:sugar lactone lactonase YvrE
MKRLDFSRCTDTAVPATLHFRRMTVTFVLFAVTACSGASVPVGGVPNALENRAVGRASKSEPVVHRLPRTGAAVTYAHAGPLLYVPNWSPSTVEVYPAKKRNPQPIATITDGVDSPEDVCIDSGGSLYVVNEPVAGAGSIAVYAAGQTAPFELITKGVDGPARCAIDAQGNIWITNFDGSNATEYLKGTKKPYAVITNGLQSPNGIAIDRLGNLYVANGPNYVTTNVQVYSPGTASPTRTITDGVTSPVGIGVDADNTLYVTNLFQNNVEEYRFGADHPFRTITNGMNGPANVTFDDQGRLYVSNYVGATIVEFALGSTTPSRREITKDLYTPTGPAHSPPLLP